MHNSSPHYLVTVEPRLPHFESERLFVVNEKEYAHQELTKLSEQHPIMRAVLPVVGELKAQDWKHYMRALDHYWDKMVAHEEEVAEGLIPVKFFVVNLRKDSDKSIRIRVRVENGTIHPAKKAPDRPERIDGGKHAPNWTPLRPKLGGFARSGVKVSPHTVEAVFSVLEGEDSADLVRQVLYVGATEDTRFTYEIRSKNVKDGERGEVLVDEERDN